MRSLKAQVGTLSVVVALGGYVTSMLLPAYDFGSGQVYGPTGVYLGWEAFIDALLFGGGWGMLAWFANPLLWIALFLVGRNRGRSWSIAFATVAFACAAIGVVGWLQTSQATDVVVLPAVYAWLASFPLMAWGALLRPWNGEAFLARTIVRRVFLGGLVVLAVGVGALGFGLLEPGPPELPSAFVHRPAVHDCGEEFVEASAYDSARVEPRTCLFEAYKSGRVVEFRANGRYGFDAVYLVTGPERLDVWIDYVTGREGGGDLYHWIDCRLEPAASNAPNYVFVVGRDPATDRVLCATQFVYLGGRSPAVEQPPNCTRPHWEQLQRPCPTPPGSAPGLRPGPTAASDRPVAP